MRTQFLGVARGQIAYDDSQTGSALVVLMPGFGDTRRSYLAAKSRACRIPGGDHGPARARRDHGCVAGG
jgi:hypothetical protein